MQVNDKKRKFEPGGDDTVLKEPSQAEPSLHTKVSEDIYRPAACSADRFYCILHAAPNDLLAGSFRYCILHTVL